jgi:hypothetical protein
MALETRKTLCLSTAHVSETTANMLNTTSYEKWPVCGGPWSFGWMMYAHDEQLDAGDIPFPNDLWDCCCFARKHGFDYIIFDQDADPVEDLPKYSW